MSGSRPAAGPTAGPIQSQCSQADPSPGPGAQLPQLVQSGLIRHRETAARANAGQRPLVTQSLSPWGLPVRGVWAAGVCQESPSKPPRPFHPSGQGPSAAIGYSQLCHQDTPAPTLGRDTSPVLWPEPRTGPKGTGEGTSVFYKLPSTLTHRPWGLCSPSGVGGRCRGCQRRCGCSPQPMPLRTPGAEHPGASGTTAVFQTTRDHPFPTPHPQPRVLHKTPTQTDGQNRGNRAGRKGARRP